MAETDTGFYDDVYARSTEDLYASIRLEAFGEDIGQFSWLTADEYRTFFDWLAIGPDSHVLEVASGSGGPSMFMAAETGCRVTGVDIHEAGVEAANALAGDRGLGGRAEFIHADARAALPFADETFDALVCIDAWNHFYDRKEVLYEWRRVLRRGGRMLFTDPITLTGMVRREEMITRSGSMGEFVFTAPGTDERLVFEAGFVDVRVEDVTDNVWRVAEPWRHARIRHAARLRETEGDAEYDGFQHFLEVVAMLARERRLSRYAIVAARAS
jgi:cyclopropane fatty-acyl-phospholipid synthase-like methyltransferase